MLALNTRQPSPGDVVQGLAFVPQMIAPREHVAAGGEQVARDFPGDAEAGGRVLAVADHEMDVVAALEFGQQRMQDFPARRADHVGDE
jgi:hypothetical protein